MLLLAYTPIAPRPTFVSSFSTLKAVFKEFPPHYSLYRSTLGKPSLQKGILDFSIPVLRKPTKQT